MFSHWKRELRVRSVLRRIARQHVSKAVKAEDDALNRLPGLGEVVATAPILMVENAVIIDADTEAAMQTCLLRGWVEILHESTPARLVARDSFGRTAGAVP